MKTPEECLSIQDIREQIDCIDKQLLSLIAVRAGFVEKAAQFKNSSSAVKAEERVSAMMLQRREWADQCGVNADFSEKLFRSIVEYFIDEEMKRWQQQSDK